MDLICQNKLAVSMKSAYPVCIWVRVVSDIRDKGRLATLWENLMNYCSVKKNIVPGIARWHLLFNFPVYFTALLKTVIGIFLNVQVQNCHGTVTSFWEFWRSPETKAACRRGTHSPDLPPLDNMSETHNSLFFVRPHHFWFHSYGPARSYVIHTRRFWLIQEIRMVKPF